MFELLQVVDDWEQLNSSNNGRSVKRIVANNPGISWRERERERDDSNVAIGVNLHLQISPIPYVIPKRTWQELQRPWRNLPRFKSVTFWVGADTIAPTYCFPRASPKVSTWLIENIPFTWIPSLWFGGPWRIMPHFKHEHLGSLMSPRASPKVLTYLVDNIWFTWMLPLW